MRKWKSKERGIDQAPGGGASGVGGGLEEEQRGQTDGCSNSNMRRNSDENSQEYNAYSINNISFGPPLQSAIDKQGSNQIRNLEF